MNEIMKGEEGKRIIKLGWIVLVLLAAFLAVETLGAIKGLGNPNPAQNTISVTGKGEAIAVPDLATFSFSVSADADTVSAAQEKVTENMNAVLSALKNLGIEEKDIKTSNYSLYPKYVYQQSVCTPVSCPPGRQVADGYTASHTVSVNLRDTELAGKALAAVGDAGATDISGISFTAEDPDAVIQEAREMAIEEARDNAKNLAHDLDVRLGKVVTYYDNIGGQPMPYGIGSSDAAVFKESAQSAPTIPQGENKVTVNVTVVYEIR
jgi:uncharacterized protein YggE